MQVQQSSTRKLEVAIIIFLVVAGGFLSYSIRMQPTNYAWELDEYDPYFNFRATEYLYENGWEAYLQWHDDLSWYPHGRDISSTSQNALHLLTTITYTPFEGVTDLYSYTIIFPVIVGTLTIIPIFFLVRFLTNPRVAALASLFFGVSLPFIQRGTAGWFKSEPLGIFLAVTATYLLISGIKALQEKQYSGLVKTAASGVIMAWGLSAWGGSSFFMIAIVIWLFIVPAITKKYDIKTMLLLVSGVALFTGLLSLQGMLFDRAGVLILRFIGLALIANISFLFYHKLIDALGLKYFVSIISFLVIVGAVAWFAVDTGHINLPYDRYFDVIVPYNFAQDPLTSSVAEHNAPTFGHIFERTVFLMIFAPVGVYAVAKGFVSNYHRVFLLIFGAVGVYIGSSLIRLELFLALSMIIFAAIGIIWLLEKFVKQNNKRPLGYVIIIMLLVVMMLPAVINWGIMMDRPPLIIVGGSFELRDSSAWPDALEWLRTETPSDSVIMAWWDYGYWIETKGQRATFMDNAANSAGLMSEYANILTDTPETAIPKLKEIGADYVLVYFLGSDNEDGTVKLGHGGDISKMKWILRIAERNDIEYYDENGFNEKFFDGTLYGNMIPYTNGVLDPQKEIYLRNLGLERVYESDEFKNHPENYKRFHNILIYRVI